MDAYEQKDTWKISIRKISCFIIIIIQDRYSENKRKRILASILLIQMYDFSFFTNCLKKANRSKGWDAKPLAEVLIFRNMAAGLPGKRSAF